MSGAYRGHGSGGLKELIPVSRTGASTGRPTKEDDGRAAGSAVPGGMARGPVQRGLAGLAHHECKVGTMKNGIALMASCLGVLCICSAFSTAECLLVFCFLLVVT